MTDLPSKTSGDTTSEFPSTPRARSPDVLFDALAHRRRRYVLECLREDGTPVALAELADEVAARERETPVHDVPAEQVERVYLSLYHTHVPKLAGADVVEYSPGNGMVELSTENERIESALELATATE